jgi:hypothetical protein
MPQPDSSLPNDNSELVETGQEPVDMEALAEKILTLLRREIESESERIGKLSTGR